jgi:hypothetical protein
MQGQHLYILGYLASVFGNSVSMLITTLGLSGYSNGYQTTVVTACNKFVCWLQLNMSVVFLLAYKDIQFLLELLVLVPLVSHPGRTRCYNLS